MIADRAAQHWILFLQRVQYHALRGRAVEVEFYLAFNLREISQMKWDHNADHRLFILRGFLFRYMPSITLHRMRPKRITVNDLMQKNYVYAGTEPPGRNFHPGFRRKLTPRQMLKLGVFGGKYMTDCRDEFPADWFEAAKLCHERHDPELNYFKVNASKPLSYWRRKKWIYREDPRGWFQWYCRYYMGRRCKDDERQIARWRAFRRHVAQVRKNCRRGDMKCRPRQRQALLQWAY